MPKIITQDEEMPEKANREAAKAINRGKKRSADEADTEDKGGDDKRYMLPEGQGTKRKAEEEPLGMVTKGSRAVNGVKAIHLPTSSWPARADVNLWLDLTEELDLERLETRNASEVKWRNKLPLL